MFTQKKLLGSIGILVLLLSMIIVTSGFNLAQAEQNEQFVFIENVGQFDNEAIRFQAHLGQTTLRLTDDALWFTIIKNPTLDAATETEPLASKNELYQGVNLKVGFANVNPQSYIEPFNPIDAHVSYFAGQDSANWQANVPAWDGVRYVDLYPGLDLEVINQGGELIYRLVTQNNNTTTAQAIDSLKQIQWQVEGADSVQVENGQLHVSTALGEFTLPLLEVVNANAQLIQLPNIEAQVNGASVSAPFAAPFNTEIDAPGQALAAESTSGLLYSTFLGGSAGGEEGRAIAVDTAGNAYVVGNTISTDFPVTPGAFDITLDGGDSFVAKLNADGTDLIYATFVGGGRGFAIAVDEAGNATVTGDTSSEDFPVTADAFDTSYNGNGDAFALKLNEDGTALTYATYLGGTAAETALDLALDEAGQLYLTGSTASEDFPTTPDAFDTEFTGGGSFDNDAFVVKLNSTGTELVYATFLGSTDTDEGDAIAIDEAGNAYITGLTESSDFPVTDGAFNTTSGEIFVAKLNAAGSDLSYATFLGGNGNDDSWDIAVDSDGNAYVAGDTTSSNFPVTSGAFQTTYHSSDDITHEGDVFAAKFNADGSDLIYATFLGGSDHDNGFALALDESNNVYITGSTYSTDFPVTTDAVQPERSGYPDAFVAKLNTDGSSLAYGTYLGGGFGDAGYDLAVDESENVYVTGYTSSTDFPTTETAFDTQRDGGQDAIIVKLATGSDEVEPTPTPVPEYTCAPTGLGEITVGDTPRGIAVDTDRNRIYVANFGSDSVSVIDGSTNTILQTITGVSSANGLAYDSTNDIIWVSNYEADTLTPIQAADFGVLSPITVGDGPWGVVYNPVNNYVYVANSLDNSVTIVNAATYAVLTTLTETFNQPFHLAVNSASGKVYVANSGHNSVTSLDGASVDSVVQLWDSGRAYGIAVDETRDTVYVATVQTNRIVAIGTLNGNSDQFLGWASFQRGYNPNRRVPLRAIAINPNIGPTFDGGHVWATTSTGDGSEANQALFIPKGWSSRFHVPFAQDVGDSPTEGIAINRTTNRVYVSSGSSPGQVTVIGDHATICGDVAPASVERSADDSITLEFFTVDNATRADLNQDGIVNILDLVRAASSFGSNNPTADLNGDGKVDITDLTLIASNFSKKLSQGRQ